MKRCSRCKIIKPTIYFYKDHTRPTGFTLRCKDCMRKTQKPRSLKRKKYKFDYDRPYYKFRKRMKDKMRRAFKKKILKKMSCFFCNKKDVEAHHSDYDKPLEIIWLCRLCHYRFHSLMRKQKPLPQ